jgi:hypothetical protein
LKFRGDSPEVVGYQRGRNQTNQGRSLYENTINLGKREGKIGPGRQLMGRVSWRWEGFEIA